MNILNQTLEWGSVDGTVKKAFAQASAQKSLFAAGTELFKFTSSDFFLQIQGPAHAEDQTRQ